ncbi:MAG TPA: Vms1/Ankzf1 family peptidyl-tRNA hydrolase [Mycobacteriales bacterium]
MIRLDTLTGLLATPGPFATAYLDATRSKELGPQEVDKRWRALRAELAEQGADEATLAAMDDAVGGHPDVPGDHGQVLVGAGGRLLYDIALPEVPRRETASWSPLPDLMPALAQLGARVPYVLALVDRTGADVTVVGPDHSSEETQTVKGDTYPIRKVGVGGWAHLRYQHRAEDLWEANARQVAEVIESAVHRGRTRLVVLAGDVRAREALRKNLDERSAELVVELQTGGRAEGIDEEKLDAEVDSVVARAALDADQAVLDRFAEAHGRAESGVGDVLAATGIPDTVAALRQAQVDTLLIVDDPSSDATAWIGPEPVHLALTAEELTELGVTEPVQARLDAALVRAAAGTDATLVTLAPGQLDVADGLGATLRYPAAAG